MFASLYSFAPFASYRFFFKSLLSSQRSRNIFGDPWLFPAAFLPKYLTGCISHCCIVGGNHGIHAHVLIIQSNEWCELPTYRCLKSASHIWVPQLLKIKPLSWLVWLSRLLHANLKGHHHQVIATSYVCSRKTCSMDVNS